MPKPHFVILASERMRAGVETTTFCKARKTARVIHNTLGLQKVKNNSISDSVAAGLWAAALKPVKVTE